MAGDLKLAYAQFEELESFARFGARLDESTQKIIEHGRRIRACLKQAEFMPVSVPAQIAVLLALSAKLFDGIPLVHMPEAELAVRDAAIKIPAEIIDRFSISAKLSDEDRATIWRDSKAAGGVAESRPHPLSFLDHRAKYLLQSGQPHLSMGYQRNGFAGKIVELGRNRPILHTLFATLCSEPRDFSPGSTATQPRECHVALAGS